MEGNACSQDSDEDWLLFEHIMGGFNSQEGPDSCGDSFQMVGDLKGNKFTNFLHRFPELSPIRVGVPDLVNKLLNKYILNPFLHFYNYQYYYKPYQLCYIINIQPILMHNLINWLNLPVLQTSILTNTLLRLVDTIFMSVIRKLDKHLNRYVTLKRNSTKRDDNNESSYHKYQFEEEKLQEENKQQRYQIVEEEEPEQESQESGKYLMNEQERLRENKKRKWKKRKFKDLTIKQHRKMIRPQKVRTYIPRDPAYTNTWKRKNGPEYQQESKYPPLFILKNIFPLSQTKITEIPQEQQSTVKILDEKEYKQYRLKDKIEMGLIDLADEAVMDKEIEMEMYRLVEDINADIKSVIQMDQKIRFLKSTIDIDLTAKKYNWGQKKKR